MSIAAWRRYCGSRALLHVQRLLEPSYHLRLPVLHLRIAPAAHPVPAALDCDQFAARSHLMHRVAHRGRLLVRHLIVLVPMYAQKGRHSLVNPENRRHGAPLGKAWLVEWLRAEEGNSAAVCRVPVDGGHVEALRMIAP